MKGGGDNLKNLRFLRERANIIIGLVVGTLIFRRRYIPVGDLRIDRSDPTSEPFLFLELGTDVRTISGMKTVTLSVRNENFLPHE